MPFVSEFDARCTAQFANDFSQYDGPSGFGVCADYSEQQLRAVMRQLIAIAEAAPQSLAQLQGISGLGVKKLEAYGPQVLRVCNGAA